MNEVIKNFPEYPTHPILYYVYNQNMVQFAKEAIINEHGKNYYDKYVTIVLDEDGITSGVKDHFSRFLTYFDPAVFKYRANGYN